MDHHQHLLASAARLSNTELLARVKQLVARERQTAVVLIAHLAELDERRLYLAEGYASLFAYCTQALHFAEHAAYNRIAAARAVRKFPVLLEAIADGSVTMATVRLLDPHLTPENHRDLLQQARHQSKRDVEELFARLYPQPPVPATIRRLPPRRSHRIATSSVEQAEAGLTQLPVPAGGRPPSISPLSPQRYKIVFTASAETREKLRRVQAMLRHQVPDGDVATIIDRALTALLEQVARQKVAATGRPRQRGEVIAQSHVSHGPREVTAARSRHIPNAVKRAVWIRDGGRCAFVGTQGRRCSEDGFLEFHHVRPYVAGGEATVENIALRCRAHNAHEAELYFGAGAMPVVRDMLAPTRHRDRSASGGRSPSEGLDNATRPGASSASRASVFTDRDLHGPPRGGAQR